jgi:SAM-dependent methyltransferase
MAERLQGAADALVALAGVREGMEVLDAACGTGNAAVAAAAAGATAVGVDLAPELIGLAREREPEIDWLVGDVEALEFEDERFDRVLSVFGAMYAPRPAVAAGELARVCTLGGRIALTAWTPDSAMAAFGRAVAAYLPARPAAVEWGDEEVVRELFAPRGVQVDLARRDAVRFSFAGAEEAVDFWIATAGHVLAERDRLEAEGRWDTLVDDVRAAVGASTLESAYLAVVATKTG